MSQGLVIIGCGGFGREVWTLIDTLRAAGGRWHVEGFVDDHPSAENLRLVRQLGSAVLGTVDELRSQDHSAAVAAIGSPAVRRDLVTRLAGTSLFWPVLIHPDATVGSDVRLGPGVVVAAGARLSTNIEVSQHVHIDQNATVGHDVRVGAFTRLNPQSCLSGAVQVADEVLVGANATVLPGLTIGSRAVVGAGAVVVRPVRDDSTVKGVPAR